MTLTTTFDNWADAWKAEYYSMTPGAFTDFSFFESTNRKDGREGHRIGKGPDRMHTVVGKTTGADKGSRFLPWKADHMTFMEIDAAATTFFTGPLSGCAIYIGRAGSAGNHWAVHANRNSTGAVNNGLKSAMLNDTLPLIGTPVSIRHACQYGQQYKNYGFILARKKAGQWEFHVADTRMVPTGGQSATVVSKLPG